MKDEHGVANDTGRVAAGGPDRPVVEPQLGERLAARETEVPDDEVLGDRLGIRRSARGEGEKEKGRRGRFPPALRQTTSQRRASRRAIEKRTIAATRRNPTCGASAGSGASRQNTFMKPSIAQAFKVTRPIFWTLSERR